MENPELRHSYLGAQQPTTSGRVLPAQRGRSGRCRTSVGEALLEVRGLTLRFGGVTALDRATFDVGRCEVLAVIGPNGAGKTSILNCLNQVYRPQEGSIRLDGEELTGRRPDEAAARGVARTFQNLALFTSLNVVDNLMLGRHHLMRTGFLAGAAWRGRARREEIEHRARCEEVMVFLGLDRYRYSRAGLLPYGVQKRIELGRALAMEPKVLLLDEPVAGMNRQEAEEVAGYIGEVNRRLGIAVILVEHDMHMVMGTADRVVVLDFGRVIAVGTPADVQAHPEVVRAYLGVTSGGR
ncbi:MAG: ABC transporter ATP-binding protein [Actinobacteria bacterium]|nr:ABC transporter ATP-binding protein [Actinomycetota bacterium]